MKRRKLIVFAFISILLISILNSCSNTSLKPYRVYVCNMHDFESRRTDTDYGEVPYNMPKNQYKFISADLLFEREEDTPDKIIILNDKKFNLKYTRSRNPDYCEFIVEEYVTSDNKIKANFRKDNGKLTYLRFSDYNYQLSHEGIETENQLIDVCNNFLSEYVDSLNRYDIEIEKINLSDENIVYEINYTFKIDDIVTSDSIFMSVTADGMLNSVSINMSGDFDRFSNVDIDIEHCDNLISNEVKYICDVDGYTYEGYDASKVLILQKDMLCLLVIVNPIYADKSPDSSVHAYRLELLIPITNL